ncbi:MAG: double-strand break repair protein AddB [Proteobacteria bacterium]|nr:double-strand break repair protein AddB [Pseudomonadota bacterium]MDA1058758.1 double-strand break repair protein AddB [Pseudomonadota bacterium]
MISDRQGDLFDGAGDEATSVVANVCTIPAGTPFVDALAAGLIERYGREPGLSRVRVLLPTRRSVRALQEAFLRQSGGRPMLLPHIRPIGDIDVDELALDSLIAEAMGSEGGGLADIPPATPAVLRQLLLTSIIIKWSRRYDAAPSEPGHAASLARELAGLIDQVQTEELSFDGLKHLVPDGLAHHWQKTLEFLQIVTHEWPNVLATMGFIDPAAYRNRLLATMANQWRRAPPGDPIVAAGSTGSIPATANLLGAIAALPQGTVVLPGLDQRLDDAAWEMIGQTHPQFGMKQLLGRIGVARAQVTHWDRTQREQYRSHLFSEVMRPAESTDQWHRTRDLPEGVLDGITRIECPGPREEAGVVALLLREALEVPGKTAALVTADRALARRVAAELQRWRLDVDDSGGVPLSQTAAGAFVRLILRMLADDVAPVALLAALKHPLAAGGDAPGRFRARVRQLELAVLHGPRPGAGFKGLRVALARRKAPDDLRTWLRQLERSAKPLMAALRRPNAPLEALVSAHLGFAEELAASDDAAGSERLWQGDAGESLSDLFREIIEGVAGLPNVRGADYPALIEELMADRVVRPRFGGHPRLAIWGPLEARLQQADLLILGGLNEGKWPPETESDPWLSRPMRHRFGLPLPERRIGLSAHDFVQSACAPEVVLTRALKVEGTPTVASRWLLRLETLVGAPQEVEAARAARYLGWMQRLDWDGVAHPVAPPSFSPPVAARPRELSATDVELLVRNPYGVYAKKVLGLRPLDPIDSEPGAADRGSFIHQALDDFVSAYTDILPDNAVEELHRFGKKAFGDTLNEPIVAAFWWPWFEQIADWFIGFERTRRQTTKTIVSEAKGRWTFDGPHGPLTVTAKADRIDRLPDGSLSVIDYKTGAVPRQEDVKLGLSPQLSVEAVIAEEGGFEGIPPTPVSELAYWKLGGAAAGKLHPVRVNEDEGGIAALIAEARNGIEAIIYKFDNPDTPYLCRPRPFAEPRFDDYEHLARFKEWAAEGEVEG